MNAKRVVRIGPPSPVHPPIVVQRLDDKTLRQMSEQELSDHIFNINQQGAVVQEYLRHVYDRMVVQHDIEAGGPPEHCLA